MNAILLNHKKHLTKLTKYLLIFVLNMQIVYAACYIEDTDNPLCEQSNSGGSGTNRKWMYGFTMQKTCYILMGSGGTCGYGVKIIVREIIEAPVDIRYGCNNYYWIESPSPKYIEYENCEFSIGGNDRCMLGVERFKVTVPCA